MNYILYLFVFSPFPITLLVKGSNFDDKITELCQIIQNWVKLIDIYR